MESKEESRKRLLELNKKQAEFYDDNIYTHREKENLAGSFVGRYT
jgi:hypothetical protein